MMLKNLIIPLLKHFIIILWLLFFMGMTDLVRAQSGFADLTNLDPLSISQDTGEKPQSKVWYHAGKWWAVLPTNSGTFVWRLDNNSWTQTLALTGDDDTQADCLVDGDTTHIFLYRGQTNNRFVSVEYDAGLGKYKLWTVQNSVIDVDLDNGVETAVIAKDSDGLMWLANAGTSQIYVRWSSWPYTNWNNRTQINSSNVDDDDICDITAFGGNKIGVLWSNQRDEKFYFRYRNDGDNETTWQSRETAAAGSDHSGVADDHINFAVDGSTIYAAIKTSYDASGYIRMGLLRRLSNGTWDLYSVTTGGSDGTRPIALLNTSESTIKVIYTASNNDDDILYREAYLNNLSNFGSEQTLISGNYNNVTSTKQNFTNDVLILASNSHAVGVIAYDNPLPVELTAFSGEVNGNDVILKWNTATEVNNYGFNIERAAQNRDWQTIGFVKGNGNSNIPHDYSFTDSNPNGGSNFKYRLKQLDNDGKSEYSDVINIEIKPTQFTLEQNYPNPFNPSTKIGFNIPEQTNVKIVVYNSLGQQVKELVNEVKDAGYHEVVFNAQNLASGVYIYTISAGNYFSVKKMSLLK